jgi:hypothetical protein
VLERLLENLLFDLRRDTIGVRLTGTALFLKQCVDTTNLESAADLVERVSVVAHELTGLRNVAEFLGEIE